MAIELAEGNYMKLQLKKGNQIGYKDYRRYPDV